CAAGVTAVVGETGIAHLDVPGRDAIGQVAVDGDTVEGKAGEQRAIDRERIEVRRHIDEYAVTGHVAAIVGEEPDVLDGHIIGRVGGSDVDELNAGRRRGKGHQRRPGAFAVDGDGPIDRDRFGIQATLDVDDVPAA